MKLKLSGLKPAVLLTEWKKPIDIPASDTVLFVYLFYGLNS